MKVEKLHSVGLTKIGCDIKCAGLRKKTPGLKLSFTPALDERRLNEEEAISLKAALKPRIKDCKWIWGDKSLEFCRHVLWSGEMKTKLSDHNDHRALKRKNGETYEPENTMMGLAG